MKSQNILIIEDEEEFAGMVQLRLTLDGYCCDVEHHTIQGIRALLSRKYDLMILDLMIPGGGGIAVLKQRDLHALKDIPVIVVTGQTLTPDLKSRLHQYGVSAILNKPYDPIRFTSIIKRCFHHSQGVFHEQVAG